MVELSPAAQLAAVINQHPNQWCLFNAPFLNLHNKVFGQIGECLLLSLI